MTREACRGACFRDFASDRWGSQRSIQEICVVIYEVLIHISFGVIDEPIFENIIAVETNAAIGLKVRWKRHLHFGLWRNLSSVKDQVTEWNRMHKSYRKLTERLCQ